METINNKKKIGLRLGIISSGEKVLYTSKSAQEWSNYFVDPRGYMSMLLAEMTDEYIDFVIYGDDVAVYVINRRIVGRDSDQIYAMITIPTNIEIAPQELETLINKVKNEYLQRGSIVKDVLDRQFDIEYDVKNPPTDNCHYSYNNEQYACQFYEGNALGNLLQMNLFNPCYNSYRAVFLLRKEDDICVRNEIKILEQNEIDEFVRELAKPKLPVRPVDIMILDAEMKKEEESEKLTESQEEKQPQVHKMKQYLIMSLIALTIGVTCFFIGRLTVGNDSEIIESKDMQIQKLVEQNSMLKDNLLSVLVETKVWNKKTFERCGYIKLYEAMLDLNFAEVKRYADTLAPTNGTQWKNIIDLCQKYEYNSIPVSADYKVGGIDIDKWINYVKKSDAPAVNIQSLVNKPKWFRKEFAGYEKLYDALNNFEFNEVLGYSNIIRADEGTVWHDVLTTCEKYKNKELRRSNPYSSDGSITIEKWRTFVKEQMEPKASTHSENAKETNKGKKDNNNKRPEARTV